MHGTEYFVAARHFASFCLVAADPRWADGLILLGSPPAGEGLL